MMVKEMVDSIDIIDNTPRYTEEERELLNKELDKMAELLTLET